MTIRNLERALRPGSIAVIGASDRAGPPAAASEGLRELLATPPMSACCTCAARHA